MSKKKNELTTDVMPDYLANTEVKGVDELKKFIVPSVLRIVQGLSAEELTSQFELGDAVLLPEMIAFANSEEAVQVVPVYFYNEFVHWNQRGEKPAILSRTRDDQSVLAKKCRDEDRREEEIDGKKTRNIEMLNYMCILIGPDAPPLPVLLSFSSAEFMTGRKWSNMIAAHGKSIYARSFSIGTKSNSNAKGKWHGFTIENNEFCTKEQHALFAKVNDELTQQEIKADYGEEDADSEASEASTDTATAKF